MALTARFATPRTIEVGVAQTLTLAVYDEATGAEQTASAGTFELWDGSEAVLDATTCSSYGPPATFSLTSSHTTGRSPSDMALEIWRMTIGGVAYVFRRTAYLVRHAYHPCISDSDLYARHAELQSLLPAGTTTYGPQIEIARERIERDLIKRGRRPALILDSWALFDAHLYLTLHVVYSDFALAIGDGRYSELSDKYETLYREEMDGLRFRYDEDDTGVVNSRDQESGSPPLVLTAGNPRARRW